MSKNKRDRLQKEASEFEQRISSIEAELRAIEESFQNPDPTADWQAIHRKYDELKATLENLYAELNQRWEALEEFDFAVDGGEPAPDRLADAGRMAVRAGLKSLPQGV